MKIQRLAITGGTGFAGRHFAGLLRERGHEPVLICRRPPAGPRQGPVHAVGLDDIDALARAFAGCDAVAHLAGINREIGEQTYERVHVAGTQNVVADAGAPRGPTAARPTTSRSSRPRRSCARPASSTRS